MKMISEPIHPSTLSLNILENILEKTDKELQFIVSREKNFSQSIYLSMNANSDTGEVRSVNECSLNPISRNAKISNANQLKESEDIGNYLHKFFNSRENRKHKIVAGGIPKNTFSRNLAIYFSLISKGLYDYVNQNLGYEGDYRNGK